MKHTEEYINELLAKYITGEVMSDSEKNDIQEWIATHADEYNRLVKLISPKKAPEFGTAKAWTRIEEHINKSSAKKPAMSISTNKNKKKSLGMSVFYAAASVLVIVVISISFFMSNRDNNKEQLFANNTAEKMMIYLPDSSSVTLYPNANVSYRTGGMNSAREVALNGKAFFNVRKMHGRAFKVQSENLMVEVLGTSFLVDATKAESSSVYVKTGVVSVKSENSKVIIKANQKAELDNKTLKTGKIENPYDVFEKKQKGISISFNQAIDMEKNCTVRQSATMSVAQLLDIILKDYRYNITEMPGRKIAIRIDAKREFSVNGTIADESTSEKLYGAIIMASDTDGRKIYSTSDENGNYRLNLTEGEYTIEISYMGYEKFSTPLHLYSRKRLDMNLKPALFEVDEVTVRSIRNDAELAEITPSGMLSFSGNDLFSQIWILPGVTGTPTGNNFMVDGGSYDENIILLDGVPVFHPGHINALLPQFNGDVIKNIVFHKGFFPTRLEGGLSSVTEFNLKDGNKNRHTRTFSIDMPAASLTLEGPIIKNKLSYLVSVRRSWMDFFDELLSEENRLNHYSFDYTAKLSYYIYRRWTMQLSYTYLRSREWFDEYKSLGKLPSLYDMPHYVAGALSYKISKSSSLSLGCIAKTYNNKKS